MTGLRPDGRARSALMGHAPPRGMFAPGPYSTGINAGENFPYFDGIWNKNYHRSKLAGT